MKPKLRRCFLMLIAVMPAAYAQSEAAKTIPVAITKYQVKPGSTVSFEEIIKKYGEAWKKSGRAFFMVFRTSMGDAFEYTTMGAIPGLQAYDGPSPITSAYGERAATELTFRLSQCLNGQTRQLWHIHPEQSIISTEDFRGARVTEIGLRNASAVSEHNAIQRKIMPPLKNAGRKNTWMLHLDYGGDDYRALSITPFEKYAEPNTGPSLTKLVGAEETKKIAAARERITAFRNAWIWSYRPDLSYRNVETTTP